MTEARKVSIWSLDKTQQVELLAELLKRLRFEIWAIPEARPGEQVYCRNVELRKVETIIDRPGQPQHPLVDHP